MNGIKHEPEETENLNKDPVLWLDEELKLNRSNKKTSNSQCWWQKRSINRKTKATLVNLLVTRFCERGIWIYGSASAGLSPVTSFWPLVSSVFLQNDSTSTPWDCSENTNFHFGIVTFSHPPDSFLTVVWLLLLSFFGSILFMVGGVRTVPLSLSHLDTQTPEASRVPDRHLTSLSWTLLLHDQVWTKSLHIRTSPLQPEESPQESHSLLSDATAGQTVIGTQLKTR